MTKAIDDTIEAARKSDTLEKIKADIRFIIRTRGPLRSDLFVRSHFWRRLRELRGLPL